MTQHSEARSVLPQRMTDRRLNSGVAHTHRDILFVLSGMFLAIFITAIDQTIVAPALPAIAQDLGDSKHLPWLVTGFFFAVTIVTPLYGKLSDIHGRRVMVLIGITLFVTGSLICATSSTLLVAILGRVVEGAGAGGLMSTTQVVVADLVPPKQRGRYLAYTATIVLCGNLLGPVLGGWFVQYFDWTLIFWINVPLGIVAYWTSHVTLKCLPRYERPHQLDLLGAGFLAAATLTVLLVLSWGGTRNGWASKDILILAGTSLILWIGFGLRLQRAPEPFLRPELFRNKTVFPGMLSAGASVGAFSVLIVFVPLYFRTIGFTPAETGYALIPLAAGGSVGAFVCARVAGKVDGYARLPMTCLAIAVATSVALALAAFGISIPLVLVALGLISFCTGAVAIICTIAIQNALAPHQFGTATAAMNFMRALSSALVVAFIGAILPVAVGETSIFDTPANLAIDGPDRAAIIFRRMFLSTGVLYLFSMIALAVMEKRPLRAHVFSAHDRKILGGLKNDH